jgi:glycosyltransferase involved in cell wall biosynthesis
MSGDEAASPLVSVIMPAYNAAAHIAEAIMSVAAQTYTHWELLVVDDGSTDETGAIVAGLTLPPGKLRYLTQSNAGEGVARNRAINEARGDLIAFLDSDDIWEPARLERQIPVMAEGAYDLVYTNGYFVGDPSARPFPIAHGAYSGREMFQILYQRNQIPVLSVLTTKRALARAGSFKADSSRLSEDYDLWLRMANTGSSFYGLSDQLVGYRDHPGSHIHRPVELLFGELAAVSQFDEQVQADDPTAYRRRMRDIYSRLVAEQATAGDLTGARQSLSMLRRFEASWRVAIKALALTLARRRYGALRARATGRS